MVHNIVTLAFGGWLLINGAVLGSQKSTGNVRGVDTSATIKQEVSSVCFCELVKHPELYDGKVVRVEAIYYSNFESSLLYDPLCSGDDNFVAPNLKCDTDKSCKELTEKVDKENVGDPFSGMRTRLVMIGTFKNGRTSNPHYGKQNSIRFEFLISSIEKAKSVPPDTTWPKEEMQRAENRSRF